jgi:regulatory protein
MMDQPTSSSRIPEWVLAKMQNYCAYQERCIQDVIIKLKSFHLQEGMEEKVILALKREKFLDEARYARVFASGKLRMNKWGKNKIYAALQKKRVPELFILQGLAEIEENEYLRILRSVISKKSKEVKEPDFDKHTKKVANFAISKGFEPSLVWDVLNYKG